MDHEMWKFCQLLPKIELHAHVNACVPVTTLRKLAAKTSQTGAQQVGNKNTHGDGSMVIDKDGGTSYQGHFDYFTKIHSLNNSLDTMRDVTNDVMDSFRADGVRYLELRSTPKDIPETGVTSEGYIRAVCDVIKTYSARHPELTVRYLPSIDRRQGVDKARRTVSQAISLRHSDQGRDVIVGIDLSGDGTVSDLREYIPVFQQAQDAGLKLGIHLMETVQQGDETRAVLQARLCDRLGHGCHLHPPTGSEELVGLVRQQRIPIELCMTSNLKTSTWRSLAEHHIHYWHGLQHPYCLCVDGSGVFQTTLTNEYYLAAKQLDLSQEALWQLSFNTIDYIFGSEADKEQLRTSLLAFKSQHLPQQ